jgi:hypothetical protein
MAFTTGTATDHNDLLDKLRIYLDTQGWTINNWAPAASLITEGQLDVTGPGIMGGQQPNISLRTEIDTTLNAYAWKVSAYPVFNGALPFAEQVNNSPTPYLLLWSSTMDYWFYVNDRRFIVIAKIGTFYMSMYAGFFLPYALPAEYPFPYFVGATYNSLQPYNVNNSGARCFADPGVGGGAYLRRTGLDWGTVRNHSQITGDVDGYGVSSQGFLWPYRVPSTTINDGVSEVNFSWFNRMRPLANGKMPMWQIHIMDAGDNTIAGLLDDVYATGGFNRVAEQIIEVGADDYRLFQNINRATPRHFFAIKEA